MGNFDIASSLNTKYPTLNGTPKWIDTNKNKKMDYDEEIIDFSKDGKIDGTDYFDFIVFHSEYFKVENMEDFSQTTVHFLDLARNNPNSEIKIQAIKALGDMGSMREDVSISIKEFLPKIIEILEKDVNSQNRRTAASILANDAVAFPKDEGSSIVNSLKNALNDSDSDVRILAVMVLFSFSTIIKTDKTTINTLNQAKKNAEAKKSYVEQYWLERLLARIQK